MASYQAGLCYFFATMSDGGNGITFSLCLRLPPLWSREGTSRSATTTKFEPPHIDLGGGGKMSQTYPDLGEGKNLSSSIWVNLLLLPGSGIVLVCKYCVQWGGGLKRAGWDTSGALAACRSTRCIFLRICGRRCLHWTLGLFPLLVFFCRRKYFWHVA